MSSRDEQLEALESALKNAEKKLKSAEISFTDIEGKIKTNEEEFQRKLSEKSAGYTAQTGASLERNVDVNGRVSYKFTREATAKEQKKRRVLKLSREFDSQTGKPQIKAGIENTENQTVEVKSAANLEKPKSRKKYAAYSMFGARRLDISAEANPFLKTVGAPIVIPAQAAVKLIEKTKNAAVHVSNSPVGQGVKAAAEIVSAPILIPAKIVKDIVDKGGVIHSLVDLGDKIRIEGVNLPKPLKVMGEIGENVALGAETAAVETAKGVKNFTIEIAKEKIYEEINKGISENDGAQAVYVVGMKMIDIYKILDEHSKFRRAVLRDKAGNDITDVDVALYLADKREKQFSREQKKIVEKGKRTAGDELELVHIG